MEPTQTPTAPESETHDASIDETINELSRLKRRAALRTLAFVMLGAVVGVAYHLTIGCSTGGCTLTATPERAAMYGMVVGLVVAMIS